MSDDQRPCLAHRVGIIGADCTCPPDTPPLKTEQLSVIMAVPPWLTLEELWDPQRSEGFRELVKHHAHTRAGMVNGVVTPTYDMSKVDPADLPEGVPDVDYVRFTFTVTMPADTIITNEPQEAEPT